MQPTARPAIALKMTNVATAAIDLVAAGIATGRHGLVTVDTDGPNTLTLSGLGAGTVVRLDQSTVIRADRGGRAVIAFPEGHHTVEF